MGGGASCVVSAVFLTESSQSRGLVDSFSLSVVFLTNLSPIDVRTDGMLLSQDVGNHMPKRWGSQGYGNLMKAADTSTVMLLLLYSILTHPAVSSHSLNVPRKHRVPNGLCVHHRKIWHDASLKPCMSGSRSFLSQVHGYQEAWSPGPGPGPGPAPAPGSSLGLEIGDTAGLAAVTIADSIVFNGPKSPIVLMHGAIQGGWVWNYSRPEIGAPMVRL